LVIAFRPRATARWSRAAGLLPNYQITVTPSSAPVRPSVALAGVTMELVARRSFNQIVSSTGLIKAYREKCKLEETTNSILTAFTFERARRRANPEIDQILDF
jgi:hypothetical protein